MIFRDIDFDSSDFRQAWSLRQRVLRVPLGLSLAPEERAVESEHFHFGLFDHKNTLLACVSAVPCADGSAKIRQMAVEPDMQGSGAGRLLMTQMEQALRARGYTQLFMHARCSARGFYEKLGYITTGDEFDEVTIPHVRMQKTL